MNSTTTRKRTHLKSNQVTILQESFNTNPLPDATVRNRLARDLEVTERTIQIWFQNRRAKARKSDNSTIHSFNPNDNTTTTPNTTSTTRSNWNENINRQVTPPRYQATFRTMMTPERFEELKQDQQQQNIRKRPRSSSKPEPKSNTLLMLSNTNNRAASEGIQRDTILTTANDVVLNSSLGQSTDYTPLEMVQLPVNVLRIGSWTRFTQTPESHMGDCDLVCYSDPIENEFVWRVQAEGHHFRIQVPFHSISRINLSQQVQFDTGEVVGQLEMEISLPLTFSMWRTGRDNQWTRCNDFTEDNQASLDNLHILQGNHDAFKRSLLELIAMAPGLVSKINVVDNIIPITQPPLSPPMDLGRDFTISPTATPEPTYTQQLMYNGNNYNVNNNIPYGMINHPPLSKFNMSHLMLQAPFFYSTSTGNQDLYQQLMLQQQQPQSNMMYSYNNNTSLLM
ncbi:hypothetical protein BDB01DRAFT_837483 [Pilobolus umbonatus]|nr:hypothetical protein BDB01DRAFT_837483 [Pilobolus umbonatus]